MWDWAVQRELQPDEKTGQGLIRGLEKTLPSTDGVVRVGACRVLQKIHAVQFSDDGAFFVTAGKNHLMFWYMDALLAHVQTNHKSSSSAGGGADPNNIQRAVLRLQGRPGSEGCAPEIEFFTTF